MKETLPKPLGYGLSFLLTLYNRVSTYSVMFTHFRSNRAKIATLPTRDAMLTQHQLWPCVCPSIRPSAPLSVTSWSYIKVAVQIQLVLELRHSSTYLTVSYNIGEANF